MYDRYYRLSAVVCIYHWHVSDDTSHKINEVDISGGDKRDRCKNIGLLLQSTLSWCNVYYKMVS